MTVINPNSISGITSITLPSGDGNVLTIHTNDGTERFRIDSSGNVKIGTAATISPDGDVFFTGVCTATTLAGSGANLTALPAANVTGTLPAISGANLTNLTAGNLTGALPAISGANLTGIAATDNVRTGILDVAGIATFRSDVNIPNINGGQIGGRRNIIINGDMQIAQRGTSSNSSGYQTVDRYKTVYSGLDNAPTFEQVDTSSSDTPYTLGLRKAFKVTNGDQTSVGAADNFRIEYKIEAQNIGQSGWNFKSSTGFITLSFWCKSSVAQNFAIRLYNADATYAYSFVFAATTSWTKITHSIKGDSGIVINNDNGGGLNINWVLFEGTDGTTSGHTNETWASYSTTDKVGDMTSTWYDTNDATFELTGVQLEVGSQATAFEHRSFGEELLLCQRYYYNHADGGTKYAMGGNSGETTISENATMYAANNMFCSIKFPTQMRAKPTLEVVTGSNYYISFSDGSSRGNFTGSNTALNSSTSTNLASINNSDTGSSTSGYTAIWRTSNAAAQIAFTAEL